MTPTTPSPISDQAAGEPKCTCAVRLMPGQIGATHSEDCPITAWGRAAFKASGESASGVSPPPSTIALEPDAVQHGGKDIMQIWFECNLDIFTFYDRITAQTTGSAPVATLHDDGCYTFHGEKPHGFNYQGWRMDVYAAPARPAASVLTDEELTALIRKVEDKLGIAWFVPDDSETYAWRTTNTNERLKYARALLAASMGGEKA